SRLVQFLLERLVGVPELPFELGGLSLQLGQVLAADAEDVVGVGAQSLTSGVLPVPNVPGRLLARTGRAVCCGRRSPRLRRMRGRSAEPRPRACRSLAGPPAVRRD